MAQAQTLKKIVDGGDMSGSITSKAFDAGGQSNLGYQVIYTGTPTGTFSVEASNDATKNDGTDGTWTALTFATALTAPAGAAGNFLINLTQFPFRWVRLKYTRTSGSGTLNVWLEAKGF